MADEKPSEAGEEERGEISRRLERAHQELEEISKTSRDIIGIDRLSMELKKLQQDVQIF